MPLTPSGPLPSRGLHAQPARRSLRRGDAPGAALASTGKTEVRRLRAELRDKARRALSPPVLGRRCGVNCFAIQHNGLLHAPPAFARRARSLPAVRATPVMSCAPQRLQRGQLGTTRRARIPKLVRPRLRRRRRHRSMARLRAQSSRIGPARPPIRPQGAPPLTACGLAQRSAVLAASRPSPSGARSARP